MRPKYRKLYEEWRTQPEIIRGIEPENVNDNAEASSSNASVGIPECRKIPSVKIANESFQGVVPQFYFPNGRPPSSEIKLYFNVRIDPFFKHTVLGLLINAEELTSLTTEVCQLPSFFSCALFKKVDTQGTSIMTRDAFVNYWVGGNMLAMETEIKVYKILKKPDCQYLSQDDFKPILQQILAKHPGLQFLKETPQIQERYAETVIYRIFYHINRSGNGRITLRELKRGNLIAALHHLDEEEDINKVRSYFSWEHFYVIIRKFQRLDGNNDFMINKWDLIGYDGQALTCRIVDRIFSQAPRKFTCEVEEMMNYEDFVYFLLSEGDKSSEPGIEYWFKCLDLDGNGKLTLDELRFFYEEQVGRMAVDPMSFADVLCQIFDMIAPEKQDFITLKDLKRSKLTGKVFNLLFNLKMFYVSGRAVEILRRLKDSDLTDWDLFAEKEYVKIKNEDKIDSGSDDESDDTDEIIVKV